MEILLNLTWVALGLVALYFGAEWLVKGSGALALRAGISPLVVGLTVVAYGTSAPELLVSVSANLEDPPQGALALGNVVGSNICNFALILGVAALIKPIKIHRQILRRDMPILMAATVLFLFMLWDGEVSLLDGIVLTTGVVVYTVVSVVLGKRDVIEEGELLDDSLRPEGGGRRAILDVLLILIGLIALIIGANRLVLGGSTLALLWGVPPAVVALSLVALGTSLPELATAVVSSLKGQGDLTTGNVVGSNIFNILAVIGISSCVAPLAAGSLNPSDLWVMAGVTFLVFPLLLTRSTLSRLEGGVLTLLYLGYVLWLYV